MIQVNKENMKKLRKRFPGIRATRTVHKYYVDESPRVVNFLNNNCKAVEHKHA